MKVFKHFKTILKEQNKKNRSMEEIYAKEKSLYLIKIIKELNLEQV